MYLLEIYQCCSSERSKMTLALARAFDDLLAFQNVVDKVSVSPLGCTILREEALLALP